MMLFHDLPSFNRNRAKGLIRLSKRAILPLSQHKSIEREAFPERTSPHIGMQWLRAKGRDPDESEEWCRGGEFPRRFIRRF